MSLFLDEKETRNIAVSRLYSPTARMFMFIYTRIGRGSLLLTALPSKMVEQNGRDKEEGKSTGRYQEEDEELHVVYLKHRQLEIVGFVGSCFLHRGGVGALHNR